MKTKTQNLELKTQNSQPKAEGGFLLVEVLIAIVILSVVLVATVGGVFQALRISDRAKAMSATIRATEQLLFELASGERLDLVVYGGRGKVEEKYQYEVESDQLDVTGSVIPFYFYLLKMRVGPEGSRNFMDLNLFLKE